MELISLTERAAEAIKKILADEKMPEGSRLRVKVVGGGCSGFTYDITFDEVLELIDGKSVPRVAVVEDALNPPDRLFVLHGVPIVVDEMSLMYLVGTSIDYVDTLMGTGFKFDNPNVKSTCGCGNSFSV